MPEICRFFGIVITMYYNDHVPAHFHVRYGDQKAIVSIDNLSILEGALSPRVMGLVVEWGLQHRPELRRNWDLARGQAPLAKVAPLE